MSTLIELRTAKGRTRARVAADLDMSERHLQRLETGETPISRVMLIAFGSYYGVDAETIQAPPLKSKREAA